MFFLLIVFLIAGLMVGYIIGAYDLDNDCECPDCENCPFPRCNKSKQDDK